MPLNRTHLSDATFHLGNAQRSLNYAMLSAPPPHKGKYRHLVAHNAKLLNICRRMQNAR